MTSTGAFTTEHGDGLIELSQVFSSTMLGLLRSPVPTIAEVTGHASAGGAILAMGTYHQVVAAEDRPAAVAAAAAELSALDRNAFAGTKSVLWDAASEAAFAEIAAS